MTTAARPTTSESCHWYYRDGRSCYEVPRASGKGMRPTTLADARKMDLLPSVTTILGVLRKPQLETWLNEQLCLAVLTTPRLTNEQLDAFVHRVIHEERHQDQERDIAAKLGIDIHDAIAGAFQKGHPFNDEIWPWIAPTIKHLEEMGNVIHAEHILVGDGYAGKCDLILTDKQNWEWVIDFKTTKKLPANESHWEHRMQTAAYLRCRLNGVRHANIYISTVNQGEFVFHDNGDYGPPFNAFLHLLEYWQIANRYYP